MARGRLISATIATSESFNAMSEYARLTWCLILPHLDDHGTIEGSAAKLKALTQPLSGRTSEEIAAAVREIIDVEILDAYIVQGRVYLRAEHFDQHQINLHKRTTPRVPVVGVPKITGAEYEQAAISRKFPEVPGSSRKFPENDAPLTVSGKLPEIPGDSVERKKELNELNEGKSKALTSARERVEQFVLTDDLRAFAAEHGHDADALYPGWLNHFRSNGYKVGRNPVVDADATFRTWVLREKAERKGNGKSRAGDDARAYKPGPFAKYKADIGGK
jgi:hypothetical protein